MNRPLRHLVVVLLFAGFNLDAQTLINVDFGGVTNSSQVGPAAVGLGTNDYWNAYSHYSLRFRPGLPPQSTGALVELRHADGSVSPVSIAVTNAPGVWGNASGSPFFDSYIFAPNGSNLNVSVIGLPSGRYHFVLYGHADSDGAPEQNSVFFLRTGGGNERSMGPLTTAGAGGWKVGQPWQEGRQYVIFRDVLVADAQPVIIEAAPGVGGVAVLNGLQILSRGTGPPRPESQRPDDVPRESTNLLVRSVHYSGILKLGEARFQVELEVDAPSPHTVPLLLFQGDLALLPSDLPPDWRWVVSGGHYRLHAGSAGTHTLKFDLVPRVTRSEAWDSVSFTGPPAGVGSLVLQSDDKAAVIQLVSGTPSVTTPDVSPSGDVGVRGVIAGDARVAFRWQSRATEVDREAVITVDSVVKTVVSQLVVRTTTSLSYDVVQGRVSRLILRLPEGLTLTRLTGEGVRDWRLGTNRGHPVVDVELIRPLSGAATLNLVCEQAVPRLPAQVSLLVPRPQNVQRESGIWTLAREDVDAQISQVVGARQINAVAPDWAAFRFAGESVELKTDLRPVAPRIEVADDATAVFEESRVQYGHELTFKITQAGVYQLEVDLPPGGSVAAVSGEGIGDWQAQGSLLKISLKQRWLGVQHLSVRLEQAIPVGSTEIGLAALRVRGANLETAHIIAGAVPGLNLRTSVLEGLREQPVVSTPMAMGHPSLDPQLAFQADTNSWRMTLTLERLAPRLVAEVFNLITVGDGLVGGSATLRYAIINQGVQAFRVRLPRHWRNIEFTGANIRRTDHQDDLWTVALQDKAWGAYTLVLTYDHAFDPHKAVLNGAGAHPLEVERETGTVAITAAPGIEVQAEEVTPPLRTLDPSELSPTDRSLIARPVLLAYRYEGTNFTLGLQVTRHEPLAVLDAVADRTQLTSVLTEQGEMLTQATFLVKNNERQYQRFQLPADAALWGVAVNGQPAKADRDGDWVLVNLPTDVDRDQVFAVDLNYAQQFGRLSRAGGLLARPITLTAPQTDVPGTYAQWELFTPPNFHVGGFGGNMSQPPGVQYGIREAWSEFLRVYQVVFTNYWLGLVILGLIIGCYWGVRRRGLRSRVAILNLLVALMVVAIVLGMLLPALSKSKLTAQRNFSANNLKQIGIAARIFESDHGKMPASLDEMITELGTDKVLHHPATGEAYTWLGSSEANGSSNYVMAYGPEVDGGREVLLADGSVQMVTSDRFSQMLPGIPRENAITYGSRVPTGIPGDAPPERGASHELELSLGRPIAIPESLPTQTTAPMSDARGGLASPIAQGAAVGFRSAIVAGAQGTSAARMALPTAAGLRSLKIEIPKRGRSSNFTRVLNLNGEPAQLRFSILSAKVQSIRQSSFQIVCFLAGLLWARREWRSAHPRSWHLAAASGLALVGIGSLLVSLRILHLVWIALPPLALVVAMATAFRRGRPLPASPESAGPPSDPPASNPPINDPPVPLGGSPLTACLLALLALALSISSPGGLVAADAIPLAGAAQMKLVGHAGEQSAEFSAVIDLWSAGTNQIVPLFGAEAAIEDFKITGGDGYLGRDGGQAIVVLPSPGRATVEVRWFVNVGGEPNRRTLECTLPVSAGARIDLAVDEPDATVEFPNALSLVRSLRGPQTRIEAVLGGTNRFSLAWMPRQRRVSALPTALFAEQASLVTLANGVATVHTVIDFSAPQGEARSLELSIPRSQRLLRVSGDLVRTWNFSATNRFEVSMELTKPTGAARVVVETEQSLDSLPATLALSVPIPRGVKHATGWVILRVGEELGVTVPRSVGLERDDISAVKQLQGVELGQVFGAWRFLDPAFDMDLHVESLNSRVEATLQHHFTVGLEQVTGTFHGDFAISRAGIFSLRLAIPENVRIDRVECPVMVNYTEDRTPTGHWLELTLKERTLGSLPVDVVFTRALTNLPPGLTLSGITPVGAVRVSGYVSATSEPGISLKSASFPGLAEIPASALPQSGEGKAGWLAFKRLPTETGAAEEWSLSLTTEIVDSWVRAETASFITVGESFGAGHAVVKYDIQNAPTKEFVLRVPSAWRHVEVTGSGIRRRDQTNRFDGVEWRIELQNKARGDYRLQVKWEQPREGTNEFVATGLEAVGVERETGTVAFYTRGQVQLIPAASTNNLLRIDVTELPDWATSPGLEPARLSYRYLRPGWRLALGVRQYQDAAVLQALIEQARLRTVVADDGQMLTQIEFQIRNNGRQSLEMTLPPGAEVWSAFVNRDPIRPATRGGQILIPLESSEASTGMVTIELTYVIRGVFPKNRGPVSLVSPRMDLPLKDAQWELFLPPDYHYGDFGGSMSFQPGDDLHESRDYTLMSYKNQERERLIAAKDAEEKLLSETRQDLALNKTEGLSKLQRFNRLSSSFPNRRDDRAYRELKDAVDVAQSSNLIDAQLGYEINNGVRLNLDQKSKGQNYDVNVARQQVAQLNRAQAVVTTRVSPLRVNLPTRGLRYNFGQVLQTRPGEPMTVSFTARNERRSSVRGIVLRWGAALACLWGLSAWLIASRRGSAQ